MFAFSLILFIAVIILLLIKFKRRFELGKKIPGPWFIPLLGNVQLSNMKPETVFLLVNEYRNKYRKSFRFWLGPNLWIFLHSPEETKQVLNYSHLGRPEDFKFLQPLLGDGLLLSSGKKWMTRRKSLNPAFHPQILEKFTERFSKHAEILVQKLPKNKIVEVTDFLFLCVLDTICETAMGAEMNSQNDPNCAYAKAFHDASHLLYFRIVNPMLWIDFFYRWTKSYKKLTSAIATIHELTERVIKTRRLSRVEDESSHVEVDEDSFGRKKRFALLDLLLNIDINGEQLSDSDIEEEVNTFLFAGIDTTTSSISFIFYNLGKYKDLQEKIVKEIWSICDESYPDATIEIDDLNKMTYLDLFMKESQRIHTTVPLTGRHFPKETRICDMHIPEDSSVWINMYGLSHDLELFKDPFDFIPERFDPNDERFSVVPYSFLPFGGGPRMCIGKRYSILIMKVIVVKILMNYEIYLAYPNEELNLISEMVLKSTNGINLVFKERLNLKKERNSTNVKT